MEVRPNGFHDDETRLGHGKIDKRRTRALRIRGALERSDGERIAGWIALVESADNVPIIEIVIDGRIVGRVEAKQFRSDVKEAGFGDGRSGFEFRFPPGISKEEATSAKLRLLGTDLYLNGRDFVSSKNCHSSSPSHLGDNSVIILGPARSGTSILFLALRTIVRLQGLGESHVLPIFQRNIFNFYKYINEFAGQSGTLASRLPGEDFEQSSIRYIREFYWSQFGGAGFVDKTPGLEALVGAPFTRKVFPAAKTIIMFRNGIEVVESYRRKFSADFDAACKEWAQCAETIVKLKGGKIEALLLDQFELRTEPELVAKRLGTYTGNVEKISALSEFFKSNKEDVLSRPDAWSKPASLASVDWTSEQRATFERLCGNAMNSLGYAL